jgi:hypothetical protein
MGRHVPWRNHLWSDSLNDESTLAPHIPSTLVIGGKDVDGRTLPARRYRAVCSEIASDLGGDPSAGQWLIINRAAGLTVQCELLDAAILTGEAVDVGQYTTLSNSLVRTLKTLGLERRAKDISPGATIDAHAAAVRASTRNCNEGDNGDHD